MKIAICDDEKLICEQIKRLVKRQLPDCAADCFQTGEALLFSEKEYDLIFLDICMEGRNGIETARTLRKRQEEVLLVFITGRKDYVFQAFDVEAFHYLLKPIEERKFQEVLKRAVTVIGKKHKTESRKLLVRTRTRNTAIPIRDIVYIENRKRKAEIHTVHDLIEIYATMKELESQMDESFYRCHRGYLVNMAYIAEYNSETIRLSNGETVFLSRERYPEFVRTYMHYLRNGGAVRGLDTD